MSDRRGNPGHDMVPIADLEAAMAEHVRDDAMSRGLDHYPAALIDAEDLLDGFPQPLEGAGDSTP